MIDRITQVFAEVYFAANPGMCMNYISVINTKQMGRGH